MQNQWRIEPDGDRDDRGVLHVSSVVGAGGAGDGDGGIGRQESTRPQRILQRILQRTCEHEYMPYRVGVVTIHDEKWNTRSVRDAACKYEVKRLLGQD